MPEYHNPQQEPGMERRLLLLVGLMVLTFIIFQSLLKRYLPPAPPTPGGAAPPPLIQTSSRGARPDEPAAASVISKQASSESETVIENSLYRITFTNRGGQVKSWILKKYEDEKGKPLEMVNQAASAKYGLPLSLWTNDEGLRNKLNSILYLGPSGTHNAPAEIGFEYSDSELTVSKRFGFDHSYVVKVETSVRYKSANPAAVPIWPAGLGDELSPASYAASRIEYQDNDRVERLASKKITSGNTLNIPLHWGGVGDRYFAAVFLPDEPQRAVMITLRNPLDIPKDSDHPNPQETTRVEVLGAGVGTSLGTTAERIFVGPKSLAVLESVHVAGLSDHADLRKLVDFGFFGFIARYLFLWLKWTTDHWVANWGWAIVIQTLVITMALLPLRISQMKSMLKMQKVAPQIKSIQEKYKKYSLRDPRKQEMQKEISELYKQEGVNPAGGCLPLVVQLPFLWAYYAMLGSAIDLRHAHWLWVTDLSAADPWHLLPVFIVVTMFLSQRMTPQAGMDPAQQKIMNFMMPVMLGAISWSLAAGLCLYWAESQLIGIVQQVIMNRTSLGREMREMMDKRARKKQR